MIICLQILGKHFINIIDLTTACFVGDKNRRLIGYLFSVINCLNYINAIYRKISHGLCKKQLFVATSFCISVFS